MAKFHSPILSNLKRLVLPLLGRAPQQDTAGMESKFRFKYVNFQDLLESNGELLKVVAQIEERLDGREVFGTAFLHSVASQSVFHGLRMVRAFENLSGRPQPVLGRRIQELAQTMRDLLKASDHSEGLPQVLSFDKVTRDSGDAVGGKSANLGEVRNKVGLPAPDGFAITTAAFFRFLRHGDLHGEIAKRTMDLNPADPASIQLASEDIQRLILLAPLPEGLEEQMLASFDALATRLGQNPHEVRVAMRSSAVGEDGELTFAGQYLSMLGVTRAKLAESYKYVAASLYTPRAMAYRLQKGVPDEAAAMGVVCLAMVDSVASGVMYTRHPFDPGDCNILINAVWGLGPYAVDGVVTPDTYVVDPQTLAVLESRVASQPVLLASAAGGGLVQQPVDASKAGQPCLDSENVRKLASWGVALETHYGCPQDVEWALDRQGDLLVLQSRPLGAPGGGDCRLGAAVSKPLPGHTVLLDGGAVACPGVGCGPAVLVRTEDDLAAFPEGGVLVAANSSPKFMVVMQKAQAILADHGSVTGHMASLSREFHVPTVLGLGRATTALEPGREVTVDAFTGRVYQGRVEELLQARPEAQAPMKGTVVLGLLGELSRCIAPLTLLDPSSPKFAPENCQSLHDVARYLHECSYTAMFALGDMAADGGGMSRQLKAGVGLDLHVIDLGGGVSAGNPSARSLDVSDVTSRPFKALLRGLADKAYVANGPRPVQIKGFLSVMGRQMVNGPSLGAERFGDKSYAIVSDKYLNFSSRVGYHYGVLDCYLGNTISKNYVTFSFKGGAAGEDRRERRARAIALILAELGFGVTVTGDRVQGRYLKYPADLIEEQLVQMGRLLQYTRQTDMLMTSEASVKAMAASFLRGDAVFEGVGAG